MLSYFVLRPLIKSLKLNLFLLSSPFPSFLPPSPNLPFLLLRRHHSFLFFPFKNLLSFVHNTDPPLFYSFGFMYLGYVNYLGLLRTCLGVLLRSVRDVGVRLELEGPVRSRLNLGLE